MSNGQDERKARLAQALRDNLRRRKAQARAGTAASRPADRDRDGDAQRHDETD
ncbi:hypothetical protein [Sphingobium cloacae]|uniref:hypothetical protein n=1 Tax=Sphingobium cloacae TaxID=120107 RepID=UPI000B1AFBF6|nr:hypothetical protein [Sphingobium cloacae]